MKLIRPLQTILSLAILMAPAAPDTRAADAPASPPAITEADAEQFFHLGEAFKASMVFTFLRTYATQLPKRFDDLKQQLVKAKAPADVIADLDKYAQSTEKLPWTKPWSEWSKDEHKSYNDSGLTADLWKNWLLTGNTDRAFYFFLGRNSISGWYGVEKNIADGNNTIADMTPTIKDLLSSNDILLTESGYAHPRASLNPEGIQALKDMSALRAAMEDPLSGGAITQDAVTKIGTAFKTLRDLAHAGKLTNAK